MNYRLVEGRQHKFVTCPSFVDNREYFLFDLIWDDYGNESNAVKNKCHAIAVGTMLMITVTLKMMLMRKHLQRGVFYDDDEENFEDADDEDEERKYRLRGVY